MNAPRFARTRIGLALLLSVIGFTLAAVPARAGVAAAAEYFFTVDPCRVYDSRSGTAVANGDQRFIDVVGIGGCGIPAEAKSLAFNLTVTGATSNGHITLYPQAGSEPLASAINFRPGWTRANNVVLRIVSGGFIAKAFMIPPGTVHIIVDVVGYFAEISAPTAVDDTYATPKDTVLNVSAATGVTFNDTLNGASIVSYGASTGGEQTTIGAATSTSAGGSIVLNADGSFNYTPPAGAAGIDDTFKYVLQNPIGSSTATVTINVGKAAQTISFTSTAPSDATVGGATYTVTATATSGLAVTFTIDASAASVCSIAGSTVSFIGNGTCVINANQAGDATYSAAPQVQQSFPVKTAQTISFTSAAPSDAAVGGATYTVTATATSGLAVTLTIDASASTVCSIAGSTVSFIGNGTCVINADQAGDTNYYAAPQVQQSFPVKTAQTITFTSSPPATPTVGGPTYTVTATATSGLTVTFTIDASASTVCSIAGSTVSFIGNGTCVINADQAGDANYYPAPQAQQSFGAKTEQSITFTSSPPATPTVGGATYTVTATATSGLAVTFTIDASASTVCSIAGSTVSFIGNGTCVINADQAGDANYYAAPQVQQSFPVKTAQTISFTSSPPATPTVGGPTYTVTATATSGLAVTFTIDASASTVCSIAGSTVSFIGNGTCVINADQAGDANYYAAPQVQQSFPVKIEQTISFTSSPPATPTVGGATYTVTATATSGLAVTFTIDASASTVCSIAGSTVSFIGNGTCVINANQAGDATYYAAPQVQQSFSVKSGQTISFTSPPPATPTVGGPTYTVTATATSGLAVTFTIDASASTVCSIAGSTVSFIGNGTCVINADQAGDANYYAAPQVQQSFSVKTAQTISFTSSPPATPTVGGPTYTVTATATSGLAVTFTIDASASTVCSIAGSTVSFIGNGTCVINANQAGDANYYAASQVQQSFGVKSAQTITFTSLPPSPALVNGPTYNVTATATSGLAVTFTIDASASTVCTIAGSTVSFISAGTCVINANQAGDANYYAAPQVQQSVLVVKQDQTITFTSTPPALATIGGPTYTVTATATSGLPVTFTIDASASTVCTIAGSTVSFIGGGTCVINANQAGNTTYNPAPQVQQSFHVNFPPQLVALPKESFDTIGNTAFEFKAAQSLSPGVFVSGQLKDNFTDSDGPSPLAVTAIVAGPTVNGGTVDVDTNGAFTYKPKAGDALASDSFTYQITDGAYTINRTVTINLKSRVWYVKNDDSLEAPTFDNGTSVDPFDTLAAAQGASSPNDYIFVYFGDGTTTGQNQGIALKNGQHLIGQFAGLRVNFNPAITFNGAAGTTFVQLLAQPSLTFCSGNPCRPLLDDITPGLPEGVGAVDVIPAEIIGLNLAGNVNAIDWSTAAAISGTGTLAIRDNIIRSAGADGVEVTLMGTGAVNLAFHDNNLTATGIGLDIQETGTGSLTITAFDDNVVSSSTGGTGININGATFDSTPTGSFNTVSGGVTVIGASGDGVGGAGMVLANVQGDLSFTDLDIFADNGAGLQASSGTAYTGSAGLRIVVGAGVGIIEASGGPAVFINTATIDLQLSSLKSTNTVSTGVSLVSVSDGGTTNAVFSAGSGSSITTTAGASGPAFNVSGGNAKITYGGTITNNGTGRAVSITSWSGDDAVPGDDLLLSGAIDENGTGILVNGNGGGRSITFSGGMDIDTATGEGFVATSNTNTGGLHITGTNTIDSVSATALRVTDTTIGNSDLNFQRISSGNNTAAADPANGIVLSNTGTSGGLKINGSGAAGQGGNGTGGLIQNTTSHGVSLTNTREPSFTNMTIQNTGGSGINGTLVTDFTFDNGTITGSGDATQEANIAFNGSGSLTGNNVNGVVTISDSVLNTAFDSGVYIESDNGTISDLTVSNNSFTSTTADATSKGDAVKVIVKGNATTVANLTRATIANNVIANFPSGAGIQVIGGNSNATGPGGSVGTPGSGTNVVSITGNRIAGPSSANRMGTSAIAVSINGGNGASRSQGNFNVSNNGTVANPITNMDGTAILVGHNGYATGTYAMSNNVIVANNINASPGIGGGNGIVVSSAETPDLTWTINNNTISNTDGNGILAVSRGVTGIMKAKIQNNTVAAPLTGVRPGIRVDAGNASSVDDAVCLNISGNTSGGSGGHEGIGLRKQGTNATINDFGIHGMAATSSPGVEQYVGNGGGQNPGTANGSFGTNGVLLLSATSGFSNCSLP